MALAPWMAVLAVFLLYTAVVVALRKHLQRLGVTVAGPLLMVRTQRGKRLVDRLALHARFWRGYGTAGTWMVVGGMALMLGLVLVMNVRQATHGFPPPGPLTRPEAALLLPGINPFVPLFWGLAGIVVAVIVHELGHAILTRVEGLTLKSMGVLLALIPIGAFAEPDEEELFGVRKAAKPDEAPRPPPKKIAGEKERLRILSAGVAGNFVAGALCLGLFFGLVLPGFAPASPTELWVVDGGGGGLRTGDVVLLNGQPVKAGEDLSQRLDGLAGQRVRLEALSGRSVEFAAPGFEGVRLAEVQPGGPADRAGLRTGDTLRRIDGRETASLRAFQERMASTAPGQAVAVETERGVFTVTLGERVREGGKIGFLGVTGAQVVAGAVLGTYPAENYLKVYSSVPRRWEALPLLMALPFIGPQPGFTPFSEPLANFYRPVGWMAPLGGGAFHLANLLFWVGWINFIVGLFNCLPAVPLDGGHVFRDLVRKFLRLRDKHLVLFCSLLVGAPAAILGIPLLATGTISNDGLHSALAVLTGAGMVAGGFGAGALLGLAFLRMRRFVRSRVESAEVAIERMSAAIVRVFALFIFLSLFISLIGPNLSYG